MQPVFITVYVRTYCTIKGELSKCNEYNSTTGYIVQVKAWLKEHVALDRTSWSIKSV